MSLSYEFSFAYARDGATATAPPISAFSVIGGASRSIHVGSPDSLSIGSEFEQARKFKNIMLFMPGSSGAGDMQAAIDLMKLATDKSRFFFHFSVTQLLRSKLIYLLSLSDNGATVRKPPMMVFGGLLMTQFNLPDAAISHTNNQRQMTHL